MSGLRLVHRRQFVYVVFSSIGASGLEGRRHRLPVHMNVAERHAGNGLRNRLHCTVQ
ncbi:hypothetical protein [Caballeronia udeis]|uniref:hypothetical protein n=1 Tax=Caballeronia udeis TaxID=1232866 RepID=UPI0012E930A7|nr:hypothetical protein [Caballeronia udeis]